MDERSSKKVALIVAHPDDETLWAGGTILSHPAWDCFIVCLCRGSDPERAPTRPEDVVAHLADGYVNMTVRRANGHQAVFVKNDNLLFYRSDGIIHLFFLL